MALADKEEEVLKLFHKLPLFYGLDNATLNEFVVAASVVNVPKGRVIYIEESKAGAFYIIMSGLVKLFRETFDGTEAVMDILAKGHIFAEFTIFDNDVYSTSAQAIEDCVLISVPTAFLKKSIQQNQKLSFNMFYAMSRNLKQRDSNIEHLTVQNASQRIGCFLLRLCPQDKETNITIQLPYDKVLLASRLGMKPETFSRALNKLRDQTGVRIIGARVEIDSIKQLTHFSCSACSSSYPCDDL